MCDTNVKSKYEGLSLVEMLITIVILGVVLLVTAISLTTMIKASTISSARTMSRNESEFIFEVLKRNIKNADADEIQIYNVNGREINSNGSVVIVDAGLDKQSFAIPIVPDTNTFGNEIQIRPNGSSLWTCIALYPSSGNNDTSYLVKGESSISGPDCLTASTPILMNEDEINISDFKVRSYESASGNVAFVINLEVSPVHWVPGAQSKLKPEYRRELVVSTDKLSF